MKKLLKKLLMCTMILGCLVGCGNREIIVEDFQEESNSYLTIYSNDGTILYGAAEPYGASFSATYLEVGMTFEESIGIETPIQSIEKKGAEFAGWLVYAVSKGKWSDLETKNLPDGQLCVKCGNYGFLYMKEYEVLSESATTEELEQFVSDGREYLAIATWK